MKDLVWLTAPEGMQFITLGGEGTVAAVGSQSITFHPDTGSKEKVGTSLSDGLLVARLYSLKFLQPPNT